MYIMFKKIDLLNPSNDDMKLLESYFNSITLTQSKIISSDYDFEIANTSQKFQVNLWMYIHQKKNKTGWTIDVFSKEPFILYEEQHTGGNAVIVKSNARYRLIDKKLTYVLPLLEEKKRAIKIRIVNDKNTEIKTKDAIREYTQAKITPHIKPKIPIQNGQRIFSPMRFFQGLQLTSTFIKHKYKPYPAEFVIRLHLAVMEAYSRQVAKLDLIHLDIKSENIIVNINNNNDITVNFVDYEYATSIKDTSKISSRGTPGTISPEMLAQKGISPKSDIYSLAKMFLSFGWMDMTAHLQDITNILIKRRDGKISYEERLAEQYELLKHLNYDKMDGKKNGLDEKSASIVISTLKQMLSFNPEERPDIHTVLKNFNEAHSLLSGHSPKAQIVSNNNNMTM